MRERRYSRCFMAGLSKDGMGFGALLVCLIASMAKSMTLDVMDGKESCVIVYAKKDETIHGNYEVLTPGDRDDFMVVLNAPSGLLYKAKGKEKGEDYFQSTVSEGGDYALCFVNKDKKKLDIYEGMDVTGDKSKKGLDRLREEEPRNKELDQDDGSVLSSEADMYYGDDLETWYGPPGFMTIGFSLTVAEEVNLEDVEGKEKNKALFLTEEAEILVQTLKALNDHESNLRSKEEIDHSSVGQTASRLIWHTFIKGVVLLAVSWTQLSYIRRFFETKRIL